MEAGVLATARRAVAAAASRPSGLPDCGLLLRTAAVGWAATRWCLAASRALRLVEASAIDGTAHIVPNMIANAKAVLDARMKPPNP